MSSLWISMKIIAAHLYVMRLSFNLFTSTSSEESYSSPCSGCTQLKTNMIKSAPKAHHYVDIREEYLWKQISILGCTCQSVWPGVIPFTLRNIHFIFCGNWKHCKTSKICLIWNKRNTKFGLTWPLTKHNEHSIPLNKSDISVSSFSHVYSSVSSPLWEEGFYYYYYYYYYFFFFLRSNIYFNMILSTYITMVPYQDLLSQIPVLAPPLQLELLS